ncbi:MAG: hypothetical protein CMI34_05570 [Opitutales bacterium]|nr:hypothetical protein [Opitutales bacterium]|tara:strand:- start:1617 stop:2870 length:1254 start_codon:yes stop_codon:yes gene_type:complete
MKILIPSDIIPSKEHNIRAGNIVLYNIIKGFLNKGVQVDFLYFNNDNKKINISDIDLLRNKRFNFVTELKFKPHTKDNYWKKFKKVFLPNMYDLFPILFLKANVKKEVQKIKPDWIFIFWSENLTHLFANIESKVFAYYGNPLCKNMKASNFLLEKFRSNFFQKLLQNIYLYNLSKIHHRIMKNIDIIGNVAKNDALYYKNKGHKNSFYITNTWFNKFSDIQIKKEINKNYKTNIFRIAANLGKLNGTANTYGLIYLFDRLVPVLNEVFKNEKFQLHIFGSGKPESYVLKKSIFKNVIFRGYVRNIDQALLQCPVFLCCNNATRYNVGHTRYLHAWTLGRCVVSHNNVRLAMPELKHNFNCLLGKDEYEIAQNIYKVYKNKKLFKTISCNGFDEFKKSFRSDIVVDKILKKMKSYKD